MNVDTSSSSSYTNAAYSSKGVSGLVSGIDTESVVESMLMNIQNKIDKQNQQKQQLLWKQEFYRDIISDINSFQSKYLSLTSNTSMRLSTFYNSMKAESSSKSVDVVAEAGAVDGDFSMQVARTATASSVTSSKVGSGEVSTSTSRADSFEFDRTVDIKIGDTTHKVDLSSCRSADDIASEINRVVGSDIVSVNKEKVTKYADADGNELTFKNDKYYDADGNEYTGAVTTTEEDVAKSLKFSSTSEFEISGSSVGMSILGLSGTVKSAVAKDEDGKEIEGQFETTTKTVNAQFCEVSDKVGGTVDMTLDGVKKSISFKEGESMEDFKEKVQKAFGSTVQVTKDDTSGNWSISVAGTGRNFTLSANADTMKAIGFSEDTTKVSNQLLRSDAVGKLGVGTEGDESTVHSFNINGVDIEYKATDSVSAIMNKINSSEAGVKISYDELSDKFSLKSTSTGEGFDINISGDDEGLFSRLGFTMSGDSLDSSTVTRGQNAVVNINGVTVERANNSFTYNGLTLNVKSATGSYEMNPDGTFATNADGTLKAAAGTIEQKAEITTDRNVDKMVETFKSFVEDYNKMIEELNELTHAKATYKSYAPLTEAQKKEMSEKEIELWEEKSKEGLLRNDRDIESFLTDMRFGLSTSKNSKGMMLSNIGIDVSDNWQDYGKLTIDEEQLKKALINNPNDVADLFIGENGIATKLNKACDEAANTSSGKPGSLVSLAGVEGKGSENSNQIQDKLDSIAEKLERLNLLYEARKERYWAQFNAMETALQNMNATSDSIYNTFGV